MVTTLLERSTGTQGSSALAVRSGLPTGATSSKIVFTSSVPRRFGGKPFPGDGIYVMNVDGSGERRLSRGWDPRWSPDGRSLAFTDKHKDNLEIYVMNADGRRLRNLTRNPEDDVGAVWSPDGRTIAFVRGSRPRPTPREFGPGDIAVMNPDGNGQRNLTRSAADESGAVWSPDGQKIAFTRSRRKSRTTDIFVMNADGSAQRRLTMGSEPVWSPDGLTIAFVRAERIYVMESNGSGQRRLAHGWAPTWSPAGQRIVFLRGSFPGELRVMNADGSSQRSLGWNSWDAPTWSPDGRRIAFAAGAVASGTYSLAERTGTDIYVVNADGSGLRRLTHRPGWEDSPVWSP